MFPSPRGDKSQRNRGALKDVSENSFRPLAGISCNKGGIIK